jgi:hypothetical protein
MIPPFVDPAVTSISVDSNVYASETLLKESRESVIYVVALAETVAVSDVTAELVDDTDQYKYPTAAAVETARMQIVMYAGAKEAG